VGDGAAGLRSSCRAADALSPDGSDCGFRAAAALFCDADDADAKSSGAAAAAAAADVDPGRERGGGGGRGGIPPKPAPAPPAAADADLDLGRGGRLLPGDGKEVAAGNPRRDDHGALLFDASEEPLGLLGSAGVRFCRCSPSSFFS
jgi:hypothetical protein